MYTFRGIEKQIPSIFVPDGIYKHAVPVTIMMQVPTKGRIISDVLARDPGEHEIVVRVSRISFTTAGISREFNERMDELLPDDPSMILDGWKILHGHRHLLKIFYTPIGPEIPEDGAREDGLIDPRG